MKGPSKARFEEIYASSSRRDAGPLSLRFLPGEGLVGIATPRSLGCIARRNRQKRRLREAFRASGPPPGFDFVLVARASIAKASFSEIQAACAECLAEAS
jgi:ribonuclease P protein component